MTKAGASNWKTPLGYHEKAIAELKRAREEFQIELQNLRELQTSQESLKAELQSAKAEFQATNECLENLVTEAKKTADSACSEAGELQVSQVNLKAELKVTKAELKAANERLENLVTEAKKTADSACSEAKDAQETVKTTCSEVKLLKDGIKNGTIVAQKALMLRGRDEKHWMRFKYVKQVKDNKYDTFFIWKSDDNTWHHVVRVEAADKVID